MQFEICVDNIESVEIAAKSGVDRLELCSALVDGGLTPSHAFIKEAVRISKISNFVMIRPRAGDFLFSDADVNIMINDILISKDLGADGIVIGALTKNNEVDLSVCEKLIKAAGNMGVTFHRAFDLCHNPYTALENIINLGCERLLTSGLSKTALLGKEKIANIVKQSNNRISIMPGAGVTSKNALEIIRDTGANEIHFSAKSYRKSNAINTGFSMGHTDDSDTLIMITDREEVKSIKKLFSN